MEADRAENQAVPSVASDDINGDDLGVRIDVLLGRGNSN